MGARFFCSPLYLFLRFCLLDKNLVLKGIFIMGNWLYYILLAVVIFLIFKFVNPIIGAIVLIAVLAYAIYAYMPTFYASKGNKAFNDGDFKEAVKQYKKCMDTKHPKLNHRINYAYMLMRVGEFDEAERVLDYILRFKSVKPQMKNMARQNRCMVYYKQGRLDEAIEDAEEAFNNGYKTSAMYAMLGYFKLLKDPASDETLNFCLEAYDYDADFRDIKDNLSLVYYNRGEYEKAKKISDEIIAEAPKFVEAYYHGAQIAVKLGEYQKAKEYLEKIPECRWSDMTTVTREQVKELEQETDLNLSMESGK